MNALSAAIRAIHLIAIIVLFGEFAFFSGVANPAFRGCVDAALGLQRDLRRRMLITAGWALAVAIASGLLWLVVEAASMSGMPLHTVLDRKIVGAVLSGTLFGRVSEVRFGLAIALSATLVLCWCSAGRGHRLIVEACGGLLAGVLLATFAWTGHAAAEQGADRDIHLVADAAHLLAAGAWLGALPPLVFILRRTGHAANSDSMRLAMRVTRRFSMLGITSVATLLLTGVANAWYTVGSPPALVGTHYGRLLLLKLMLFAVMIALASINRLRLTPQLATTPERVPAARPPAALRWLWRNAITETAIGTAILTIVGALGITVPALHVQPLWPFPYTLNWEAAENSQWIHASVLIAGSGALLSLILMVRGRRSREQRLTTGGLAGFVASLVTVAWLMAEPAYPTTYFRSPLRYTAASIANGRPLFSENCVVCHGPYGHGDGPMAGTLPVKPANLAEEHLFHHGEGNLFWWLMHGIAGTPMPGFGNRMNENQIWNLINFLRAQAESHEGRSMDENVEPWRPLVAPDFTFQIGRLPQESLKQQRHRFIVLLVLYEPSNSLARLRALSRSRRELERAGVRVIALPMENMIAASPDASLQGIDASLLASPNPDVVASYELYARTSFDKTPSQTPRHMEFLIDRQGYLRARWLPPAAQGWREIPDLLRQVAALNREAPRPLAPEGHVH